MLSIIGRELNRQAIPYFYLDGNTPSQERVELCNRFNEGKGYISHFFKSWWYGA